MSPRTPSTPAIAVSYPTRIENDAARLKGPLDGGERLVFQHIAKCAGTTVHEVLSSYFLQDEICPARHDTLFHQDSLNLRKYKFFSGHFSKLSIDAIPGPKRVITFLREPTSRILSLYYFWRSHKVDVIDRLNLVGPRLARGMALLDFLNKTHQPVSISAHNHITRMMIGHLSADQIDYIEQTGHHNAVQTALHNLQRYFYVGFVETLEENLLELCQLLKVSAPTQIPTINSTSKLPSERFEKVFSQNHSAEVILKLNDLTDLDRQLFEVAYSNPTRFRCPYPM